MTSTGDNSDARQRVLRIASECIAEVPVMVLGSGASVAYGIRGMPGLAEYLIEHVSAAEDDSDLWDAFKNELARCGDLENALQAVHVSDRLRRQIVSRTREMVLEDDRRAYDNIIAGNITLPLSRLFSHLFRSTHRVVQVVTTNYDRLVEYAACQAGVRVNTGFTDGAIRYFACPKTDPNLYSRHENFRCVDILKVHGSIDWFQADRQPLGVLDHAALPESFIPLIVTPGVAKYSRTHQEPFRSVITFADEALSKGRGFLCVGYGFADDHIEPKLITRTRQVQPPVIILAKELRPGSKKFLLEHMHSKVVAFVEDAVGSRAYTERNRDGILFPGECLWSLEGLVKKLEIH